MQKTRFISLLFLSLVAAACAKPAKPTIVSTHSSPPDAVNVAVRVLSQHGLTAAHVDEAAGVVQSEWQATDFLYGEGPSKRDAYIVRRFTVTVVPGDPESQVRASVEDMRCEDPGLFVDEGSGTHAGCLAVEGVVPPDQEKLDAIGADLQRALN
jgi:hypothetical protein